MGLNKITKLKDNVAFKNGIWMYLLQFFNAVVPLLTLPYITRMLGTSMYGVFSIAHNVIVYLQVLVDYGFGMSATRKVAIDNNKDLNKLFTSVFLARLFLLLVCYFVIFVFIAFHEGQDELNFSLLALTPLLIGNTVQMNWLFQGKQDMKYISLVNIISRIISVVLIFVFVRQPSDVILYSFFYSISTFLSGFVGYGISRIKYKIRPVRVSFKDVIMELRDGWLVFTTQFSSKVFGSIGLTFLGIYASTSEVGAFSVIQKIPNILMLGWSPISQVLYPISSKKMKNGWQEGYSFVYKVRKFILPMFIFIAIVICGFAPNVVAIVFGEEYRNYYYWSYPLLAWLIIAINNNFQGVQILLASGHDKEYSGCFQIGVACTILFNFSLIILFKGDGAALGPLLSELTLCVLLQLKIKKINQKNTVHKMF